MRSRRKKKNTFGLSGLIIPFVFILAVTWVWKANEVNNLSRELTDLERTKRVYIKQNKLLQAELEKYHSISWIDNCVRHNYGMTNNVKLWRVFIDKPAEQHKTDRSLFASITDFISKIFKMLINRK